MAAPACHMVTAVILFDALATLRTRLHAAVQSLLERACLPLGRILVILLTRFVCVPGAAVGEARFAFALCARHDRGLMHLHVDLPRFASRPCAPQETLLLQVGTQQQRVIFVKDRSSCPPLDFVVLHFCLAFALRAANMPILETLVQHFCCHVPLEAAVAHRSLSVLARIGWRLRRILARDSPGTANAAVLFILASTSRRLSSRQQCAIRVLAPDSKSRLSSRQTDSNAGSSRLSSRQTDSNAASS
jgi:hypothetical protein